MNCNGTNCFTIRSQNCNQWLKQQHQIPPAVTPFNMMRPVMPLQQQQIQNITPPSQLPVTPFNMMMPMMPQQQQQPPQFQTPLIPNSNMNTQQQSVCNTQYCQTIKNLNQLQSQHNKKNNMPNQNFNQVQVPGPMPPPVPVPMQQIQTTNAMSSMMKSYCTGPACPMTIKFPKMSHTNFYKEALLQQPSIIPVYDESIIAENPSPISEAPLNVNDSLKKTSSSSNKENEIKEIITTFAGPSCPLNRELKRNSNADNKPSASPTKSHESRRLLNDKSSNGKLSPSLRLFSRAHTRQTSYAKTPLPVNNRYVNNQLFQTPINYINQQMPIHMQSLDNPFVKTSTPQFYRAQSMHHPVNNSLQNNHILPCKTPLPQFYQYKTDQNQLNNTNINNNINNNNNMFFNNQNSCHVQSQPQQIQNPINFLSNNQQQYNWLNYENRQKSFTYPYQNQNKNGLANETNANNIPLFYSDAATACAYYQNIYANLFEKYSNITPKYGYGYC